jgi:hypothetical protein
MIKAEAKGLMTKNREMINLGEIPAEEQHHLLLLSSILSLRECLNNPPE